MSFKRAKVVMLSNRNGSYKSGLYLDSNNKIIKHNTTNSGKMQHLYITSDEKIKEGDWIYDTEAKYIRQLKFKHNQTDFDIKIIATTDKSLGLPQPSQQFIEKYIEEYNKSNQIVDVLVEYQSFQCDHDGIYYKPRIDKNNTITIKKVKDNYSKIEVHHIVRDVCNVLGVDSQYAVDYIKENL